jgi:glycosyltransferase involved in cell wall biosynthesis
VIRVKRKHPGDGTVLIAHPSADLYGSDRVMLETVEALTAAGRRVVVSVPGDGPLVSEIEQRGASVEFCQSPVLRKSALRPVGMVKLIAETLRSIPRSVGVIRRSRSSLVLVNTVTVPLWIPVARLAGRPVICHVHEGEASAPRLLKLAIALPLLLANRLIVNSRFSLGVLTGSLRGLGRRATVVLNAVPGPPRVSAGRDSMAGLRVLFVGRLSPRKGPDIALQALALLRSRDVDAHLDVLGAPFPGYEWFEAELHEFARSRDLLGQTTFHGFQSDVWPVIEAADVVVVPSVKDEPFGNTAVEAVLAARPVVVSATSGLREATDGYACAQQVRPADPVALADAIEKVYREWPWFREQALADAAIAADRHAQETYAAQVCRIVDEVLPQVVEQLDGVAAGGRGQG